MDIVDVIRTIIQQNPKTWAWDYKSIVQLPDDMGLFFHVNSKFQGYVMILHNTSNKFSTFHFMTITTLKYLKKRCFNRK